MINIKIDTPLCFFGLLLIPILMVLRFYLKNNNNNQGVAIPNYTWVPKNRFIRLLLDFYFFNKIFIIILLIIALSRPQLISISEESIDQLGIDIILVIDVSNSMLSRDLYPNRLSVLKQNVKNFIKNRIFDRIGIVIFSGEAITKIPLTLDKKLLSSTIAELDSGFLDDGTAIGMGIGTAINHFKYSQSKTKIIVLMTDGDNNVGLIDPYLAANIATSYGIKIYTIGLGTKGYAETPIAVHSITGELEYRMMPVTIGENLLINISKLTGAKYFRAKSNHDLEKIYNTIDTLEKYKINQTVKYNYKELYRIFIIISLFLLFVELICKLYFFKFIN